MPENQKEMRERSSIQRRLLGNPLLLRTFHLEKLPGKYCERHMISECQNRRCGEGRTRCNVTSWGWLGPGNQPLQETSPTPVTRIKTYLRAWNLISSGFINPEFMPLDWVWFDVYLWFASPFMQNQICRGSAQDIVNPSYTTGICLGAFVNGGGTLNSLLTRQSSGYENFQWASYS